MNKYFSLKEYPATNAKKVLFFFPAGFTKMWQYRWTISVLNRLGITVVGFNFAWRKAIQELDFDQLLGLISQVDQIVDKTIRASSPHIQFSALGISFGSVPALYAAKRHTRIRSIVLFVPYGTLSHLFWTYKPSRPFIDNLIRNGLSSEQALEKLTRPIETQYQLEKLKGRQIVSFRGLTDRVVFDGEKLVDAVQKQNIDATFYESRFGHFGATVVGLAQTRKWTKIL